MATDDRRQGNVDEQLLALTDGERREWRAAYDQMWNRDQQLLSRLRLAVHMHEEVAQDDDAPGRLFRQRVDRALREYSDAVPKLLAPHEMRAENLAKRGEL